MTNVIATKLCTQPKIGRQTKNMLNQREHKHQEHERSQTQTSSPTHANKCLETHFDRLIAQKIDLNQLSRPVIKSDGTFDNPFPEWSPKSFSDLIKFLTSKSSSRSNAAVPKDRHQLDRELPIVKPNFSIKPERSGDFRVTWIGHATLLIQVDGLNILTDPQFSDYASPVQFLGPKRYRPPACKISELPDLDVVLVSHNHYDHLDTASVRQLNDRFMSACRWIVPLGLGEYLKLMKVTNYVELDWWQKDCFRVSNNLDTIGPSAGQPLEERGQQETSTSTYNLRTPPSQSISHQQTAPPGGGPNLPQLICSSRVELDIYLTPSQHWSRRGLLDTNKSLWGSYTIISGSGAKFFFAGDTGYCSVFKEIGNLFGPFTGAAIPIGAYDPRWLLKASHVNVEEAVRIHQDLESSSSMAIHHATFVLSNEPYKEPQTLLNELMSRSHQGEQARGGPFVGVGHGESLEFRKHVVDQ